MPWKEVSTMFQRHEFIQLALQPGTALRALCRRFGISPPAALEAAIGALRLQHPTWGGRTLQARLRALGYPAVPAPRTITAILRRTVGLPPVAAAPVRPWQRFEVPTPNVLWQMDFKGHFSLLHGRCHPLTVLDDCSRFALCLHACPNEQGPTVHTHLTRTFRRYGLPSRRLMDTGPPWGTPLTRSPLTPLTV